jgi:hypothetical protein
MRYLIIIALLLSLTSCSNERRHTWGEQYEINYSINPSKPNLHKKWVGVPGGQISVDKDDKIIEFVDWGGKKYAY